MNTSNISSIVSDINEMIVSRGKEENDPRRLERDIEVQRKLDEIQKIIQQGHTVDGQYGNICENILNTGVRKGDRTGTGTLSVFGGEMTFDISCGKIPLLTTKKVYLRAVIHELLWFLSGDTDVRYLKENNVNIWDSWVDGETATYRDYSEEEIIGIIKKHFGVDTIHLDHNLSTNHRYTRNEDHSVTIKVGENETWKEVYRVLFTKEPRDLVSGDLPNVYGKQWRRWEHTTQILEKDLPKYEALGYEVVGKGGKVDGVHFDDVLFVHREIDQIQRMVKQLKTDPDSRRIILSPWNVGELEMMALPPCHCFFQLWTRKLSIEERIEVAKAKGRNIDFMGYLEDGDPSGENALNGVLTAWEIPERELSSHLHLRSNDMPLGNPFNIAQYAILTHMFAHVTNMTTGTFKWTGGDTHVYLDQVEALEGQLKRQPYPDSAWVMLNPEKKNIDDFVFEDFKVFDYKSHGPVKFPTAAV